MPKYTKPRNTWQYSNEFKVKVVQLSLMQEMGLIARVTRVTYRAPGMRRFLASGENLRSDGAVPEAKNKVWVADVTYLKVKSHWYWIFILDVWLVGA